jgi:DHA1 family multidrug resistance protein-like MFS transporter
MLIKSSIFTLYIIFILTGIGYGIITPIIPVYINQLGISAFLFGIMTSSFTIAMTFSSTPGGILADKIGRKKVLLSGIFLLSIASLIFPFIKNAFLFILLRIIEGIGAGLLTPSAISYIHDFTTPERRGKEMGTFNAVNMFGIIIGPAFGGLIADKLGLKTPFIICGIIGIIATIYGIKSLSNIKSQIHHSNKIESKDKNIFSIINSMQMIALFIRGLSVQFVSGMFITILPIFIVSKIKMKMSELGIFFFLYGLTTLLGSIVGGIIADKIGRKKPAIICGAVLSIILYVMPFSYSFLHLIIAGILLGIFAGINNPALVALITESVPHDKKATSMGIYQTISGIGLIIGPITSGYLYDRNLFYPFWLSAFLLLLGTIIILFFVKETLKIKT